MIERICPTCGETIIDNCWYFLFHRCNVPSVSRLPIDKPVEIIKDVPTISYVATRKKQAICDNCIFDDDTNSTICKLDKKKGYMRRKGWDAKTKCSQFIPANVPCENLHPWQDKESLFCDTDFLRKFLGKEPLKVKSVKMEIRTHNPSLVS